jgi:hypothetical protein
VPRANHQRIVLRYQRFGSSRQQSRAELRKRKRLRSGFLERRRNQFQQETFFSLA